MTRRIGFGDERDRPQREPPRTSRGAGFDDTREEGSDAAVTGGRRQTGGGVAGPSALRWLLIFAGLAALTYFSLSSLGGLEGARRAIGDAMRGDRPLGALIIPLGLPILIGALVLGGELSRTIHAARRRAEIRAARRAETGAAGAESAADAAAPPKSAPRIGMAIALSVWLVFWSFGILAAASVLAGDIADGVGAPSVFLIVWLAFALAGGSSRRT